MFGRQKKAIVSALHLPEDVVLGEMLLYFTGSRAAVVENYRSILFFSDEMLRLTGKNTRLTIKGKGLSIEYYDRDNLRVTGADCVCRIWGAVRNEYGEGKTPSTWDSAA